MIAEAINSVRLAWFNIPAVDLALSKPLAPPKPLEPPPLLVSYYYLEPFLKTREFYHYRDWVMDSGAYSAHNSGAEIDLSKYIDTCLALRSSDPTMTEVFALDKIPGSTDPVEIAKAMEVSLKNTEEMWRQGVPAIPCYHVGEPEEVLFHIAKTYPKIALGGMVGNAGEGFSQDRKFRWLEQCFARVWPKRIHGFGVSAPRMVLGLPFHSVDATNWEIGPCAFGNWQKFGAMSVKGSSQDLRSQVAYFRGLEQKARVKFAPQLQQLKDGLSSELTSVRLAAVSVRPIGTDPTVQFHKTPKKPKAAKEPELAVQAQEEPKKSPATEPPPPPPKAKGVLDDKWANWRGVQ